ncbi:MAG: DUF1707 SHOCT-like domain-containing protein [Corynebacterium sp.]|uniref:DUF1707 SHOCT-like domain-containing protein n=1 Tax=unclassified Corynebacterium TaxID=2624378 RepID=UPI002647DC28|nr:DUF1707 domain-containing protein [Corynebacterium sp.]MDN5582296.1 DUF1707 domain-containing protein [Corynebacterium sp.]MDN5719693.1 DUF1707 domain-containing protein [Corynebacterium sp.]MDN6258630.1 DUF1707 domain-containing protein [Corynebacterium sp.]MDN6325768.1 DUF1707 domain-containing protein [Corynebacterium sp.]MDN6387189.1 DUF1707 domain-containing protein [Corynebacterium sp.]
MSRDPRDPTVRIGDADREAALSVLAVHFADGRITLTEYDDRCREAAAAQTRHELDVLFHDLPALPNQSGQPGQPGGAVSVYSAGELAEQHRRGARPRAGIMALTTLGSVAGAIALGNDASALLLLLIPAVAVLLYVLKVGPESWHTPSPEALERARMRRLRREHRLALEEQQHTQQLALEEQKARRKMRTSEMTGDAMDMAQRAMKGAAGRFRPRRGEGPGDGPGTTGPRG